MMTGPNFYPKANAKDLDRLAAFYHPDVTIVEGGYVNTGWIDYRDNHLGPELKEMQGKPVDAEGLETLVLVKGAEGRGRSGTRTRRAAESHPSRARSPEISRRSRSVPHRMPMRRRPDVDPRPQTWFDRA